MTTTTTVAGAVPETPAALAGRILDAIEDNPEAFNMGQWFRLGGAQNQLPPDAAPTCGTTMCIAGWAAHLTGWTLRHDGLVAKGDAACHVDDVARKALGISFEGSEDLFWASRDEALQQLRAMAGR